MLLRNLSEHTTEGLSRWFKTVDCFVHPSSYLCLRAEASVRYAQVYGLLLSLLGIIAYSVIKVREGTLVAPQPGQARKLQ